VNKKMPKEEKGFRGVSLKSELLSEVERFIVEHPEYRGAAEFVSEAIRLRMEELRKIPQAPPLPRFEHFNKGPGGVRITDRKLHRIAEIHFKPEGIFCELDQKDSCEHIDFALTIPEIQAIIRKKQKEGWKLPDP
jgi:hypothetical protein